MRKVVITGMGIVNSLGKSVNEVWGNMKKGLNGISKIERIDTSYSLCQVGGEIKDFNSKELNISGKNLMNYTNQLQLLSVIQACSDSDFMNLDASTKEKCSVFLGNQLINIDFETIKKIIQICSKEDELDFTLLGKNIKKLPPLAGVKVLPTVPSHFIAKSKDLHGEGNLLYSAETSSLTNITQAANEIRNGEIEHAIVSSTFSPFTPLDFYWVCSQGLVRPTSLEDKIDQLISPFDKRHKGLLYGEGAATLIIESEESALKYGRNILAYVNGGAMNMYPGDTFYSLSKEGFESNIKGTLELNSLLAKDIQLIYANGTSYADWDNVELDALTTIWESENISISSSKGYIGYTGSASGIMDCIFAIKSMEENYYIPNKNLLAFEDRFNRHSMEYFTKSIESKYERSLIVNAGTGGSYCSLVLEKGGKHE